MIISFKITAKKLDSFVETPLVLWKYSIIQNFKSSWSNRSWDKNCKVKIKQNGGSVDNELL